MKKYNWLWLVLIITTKAYALPNIHWQEQTLLQYANSGVYNTEVREVIDRAKKRLAHVLQQHLPHKKLAIVLDIDETSLSNLVAIKNRWHGRYQAAICYHNSYRDPAIKPTLALYRYAIANGVAVFFITGRSYNERQGSASNLKAAGYHHWQQLILRSKAQLHQLAEVYKAYERKKITQAGYDIVINIGDQYSDLQGGYADYSYKLPNPFYYVP